MFVVDKECQPWITFECLGFTGSCRKRSRLITRETRKTSKLEYRQPLRNTGGIFWRTFLVIVHQMCQISDQLFLFIKDVFPFRYLIDLTEDLVEPGDWRKVDCVQVIKMNICWQRQQKNICFFLSENSNLFFSGLLLCVCSVRRRVRCDLEAGDSRRWHRVPHSPIQPHRASGRIIEFFFENDDHDDNCDAGAVHDVETQEQWWKPAWGLRLLSLWRSEVGIWWLHLLFNVSHYTIFTLSFCGTMWNGK